MFHSSYTGTVVDPGNVPQRQVASLQRAFNRSHFAPACNLGQHAAQSFCPLHRIYHSSIPDVDQERFSRTIRVAAAGAYAETVQDTVAYPPSIADAGSTSNDQPVGLP